MTEISAADGLCNGLYLSITGEVDMTEWADAGYDTASFDGYQVGYAMILEDPLALADAQITCFGAEEDAAGYFCTGVFGSDTVEGNYSVSAAAYWYFTEEELAANSAMDEVVEVEEEVEGDDYAEYEEYAEYDEYEYAEYEDPAALFAEWFSRAMPMDDSNMAWYEPAAECTPVFDEYYGEYGTECAVPETMTFTGSWF
jgi:hypothetical protein